MVGPMRQKNNGGNNDKKGEESWATTTELERKEEGQEKDWHDMAKWQMLFGGEGGINGLGVEN